MRRAEGEVRKEVVDYGRLLYGKRLVNGLSGNISGRVDEDAMVITPSGMCKGALRMYDLVRMTIKEGKVTAGGKPSTETPFHLAFYRERAGVGGVVHAHPLFCSVLACAGRTVRTDLTPEGLIYLGEVAMVPYATPGSEQLAGNLRAAMEGHDAFILQNHGAIAVGKDVAEAFYRLESLEFLAELQVRSEVMGGVSGLPPAEVEAILRMAGRGQGGSE